MYKNYPFISCNYTRCAHLGICTCMCVLLKSHMFLSQCGNMCWGLGVVMGPGKRSNHKHLNQQMALMSCAKQPVLTDEPVNPG